MSSPQRIHKILAQAGIASRRKAEELVGQGLVTINGQVAKVGDHATWGKDAIKVDGKLVTMKEPHVYICFNKPRSMITAFHDPEGRPTLATSLTKKVRQRVFPIDRLPFNAEGLLILTNDGDAAEKLQKSEVVPRVYQVKVKGHPDDEMVSRLEKGGKVNDEFFKPHSVKKMEEFSQKARLQIVVMGTTGVDLKAFCESKGFLVEKVTRTAIGQITLHGLEPEQFRYLKKSQIDALTNQPELATRIIDQAHKKVDLKRERAMGREERFERDERRERDDKKAERKAKGGFSPDRPDRRPGAPRTMNKRFEDMYGKPGKSWEDRPAEMPKVASGWLDQDENPAKLKDGARIHFGRKPSGRPPRGASAGGGATRDRWGKTGNAETRAEGRGGARGGPRTPRSDSRTGAGGGYGRSDSRGGAGAGPRTARSDSRPGTGGGFGRSADSRSGGGRGPRSERSDRPGTSAGGRPARSGRPALSAGGGKGRGGPKGSGGGRKARPSRG